MKIEDTITCERCDNVFIPTWYVIRHVKYAIHIVPVRLVYNSLLLGKWFVMYKQCDYFFNRPDNHHISFERYRTRYTIQKQPTQCDGSAHNMNLSDGLLDSIAAIVDHYNGILVFYE